MSYSGSQRLLLTGLTSTSDDFLSPFGTFLSINSHKNTLTTNNDECEAEPRSVTPPALYPSPPHTEDNAARSTPLPSPTSSLYAHAEHTEEGGAADSDALLLDKPVGYSDCVSSTGHIGGILDSPLVYMPHSVPISPPPTLPRLTADLPRDEDQADPLDIVLLPSLLGSHLEDQASRNFTQLLPAVETDQFDQSEFAPQNFPLLSPLSPQFAAGITNISTTIQLPHSSRDIGDVDTSGSPNLFTESFSPFDCNPMDLNSLLLDQEAISSKSSNPLMFEQEKCPWMPQSLYLHDSDTTRYVGEITTTTPHRPYPPHSPFYSSLYYQVQDQNYTRRHPTGLSYPSPDISPEQPMKSAFLYPSSPSIGRQIELEDREHFGFSELTSGHNQYMEPFNQYDFNDHYDYDYDCGAPGSQSPSIRTLSLPELEDEHSEVNSGLGLSLTSFPTSSNPTPMLDADFSEGRYPLYNPPSSSSSSLLHSPSASLATSSISEPKLGYDSESPPLSFVNFKRDKCNIDNDHHNHEPSSSLLLEVKYSPLDTQIAQLSPSRSTSPNALVESLDSRLSHLPLGSSPTDIPSDVECAEYSLLRSNPELYQDLLQLLTLRRKAQTVEKDAKRREQELGVRIDMSGTGHAVKLPSPSLAVAQAEKLEARSTRKREKEKCREITAMVALTLFNGGDGEVRSDSAESGQASAITLNVSQCTKEKKKKKKKVTLMNMAQLVARMILRRKDPSCSSSSFSRSISHQPLFSPPGVGPRRHAKSPLWQSMTIDHDDCEDENVGLGVEEAAIGGDTEENDDDLGVGLRLKGFGDFGDGPEWPIMVGRF